MYPGGDNFENITDWGKNDNDLQAAKVCVTNILFNCFINARALFNVVPQKR